MVLRRIPFSETCDCGTMVVAGRLSQGLRASNFRRSGTGPIGFCIYFTQRTIHIVFRTSLPKLG